MKDTKIKQFESSQPVVLLLNEAVGDDFIETTAGRLAAAGFGELECEVENIGDGEFDAAVTIESRIEYKRITAALCRLNKESAVMGPEEPVVMGRPPLPKNKRASEQIQLRVTANQKANYTDAAARARIWNLSEWIKQTLDKAAAGK